MIRLRPEHEVEYRRLHANVWPGVLATLRRVGVRNYSIFLRDGLLFSYLEYLGDDWTAAHVTSGFVITTIGAVLLTLLLASPPVRRVLTPFTNPISWWESRRAS